MFDALPKAKAMLADKGSDGNRFRLALAARKITACILSKIQPEGPHTPRSSTARPQNREYVRKA